MECEQTGIVIRLDRPNKKAYLALASHGCYYEAYGYEDLLGQEIVASIHIYEAPLLLPLEDGCADIHGVVTKVLLKI
ncbi:hypothetical protein ANSO36C_66870 (plasmid) [Nostoc cf. commune SO-36]|uniref:Uncharacterized protein n=1 Tax=Nostoc cf. commune SO-36 TaxID=449208 RepID=A0ABN6QE72_NOSCO|nr:hypothetical protein [Nostoc commune]BDI20885.1 hypothetical protein ANSO36C_66870 [Nostoc cf. commune SO-36]